MYKRQLEDLYAPWRPKRRTRASIAREKRLGPLADLILAQPATNQTAEQLARPFLSDDAPTVADALAGARDIVAETISDHAAVRGRLRERAMQVGVLTSRLADGTADDKSIDDKDIQQRIVTVMEGGEDAFRRRKEIYQLWKSSN